MSETDITTNFEDTLVPDPGKGPIHERGELVNFATKKKIKRISAEKGINVSEALSFLTRHESAIDSSNLPTSLYSQLK